MFTVEKKVSDRFECSYIHIRPKTFFDSRPTSFPLQQVESAAYLLNTPYLLLSLHNVLLQAAFVSSMLSPLTRSESPTRNMDIVRIGHPRSPKNSDDAGNNDTAAAAPNIFTVPAAANYQASGFVHTVVTRCGNNRYTLAFQVEGKETVALIAQKLSKSRTSNYHLFDAMRAGDAKLTKKAGHYVGKLRRDKDQPQGCYTLYDSSREKQQLAAFVYDIPDLMSQVKEGQPPRKMQAVIPKYSSHKQGGGNKLVVEEETVNVTHHNNRLMEHLHNGTWKHHSLVAVQTRPPTFQQGQYRLNFQGRGAFYILKNILV